MITHGLVIYAHQGPQTIEYQACTGGDYALSHGRSWRVQEIQPRRSYPRSIRISEDNPHGSKAVYQAHLQCSPFQHTNRILMGWSILEILTEKRDQFSLEGCDHNPSTSDNPDWNFEIDVFPRVRRIEIGMIQGTVAWKKNLWLVVRQLTDGTEQTLSNIKPGYWTAGLSWKPRSVAVDMLREVIMDDVAFADKEVVPPGNL